MRATLFISESDSLYSESEPSESDPDFRFRFMLVRAIRCFPVGTAWPGRVLRGQALSATLISKAGAGRGVACMIKTVITTVTTVDTRSLVEWAKKLGPACWCVKELRARSNATLN